MASTANTIMTTYRRQMLAQASAGAVELPPILYMVFGDGGVDSDGNIIAPTEDQTTLYNEIYRAEISGYEVSDEGTTVTYTCSIDEDTLNGENISEIALADSTGALLAIRTMTAKGKDEGLKMTFTLDDIF